MKLFKFPWGILCTVFLAACSHANFKHNADTLSVNDSQQINLVNCLLPGQIRKLGRSATYLIPGQAVKTSITECKNRGGRFI